MKKELLVNMDYWFLVKPDSSDYCGLSEDDIIKEINYLANQNDIRIQWYWNTRDTGFGLERLAFVEGHESDIHRFLKQVNDWV